MPSIFQYKLRSVLEKELRDTNLFVSKEQLDHIIDKTLKIVEKMDHDQRVIHLRQYQVSSRREREMIRSIIEADENIGEPGHAILIHIKQYLKHFIKRQ